MTSRFNSIAMIIKSIDRPKAISAAVTVLTVLAVLMLVLVLKLRYDPNEKRIWPPEDTSELLFDGEFVMAGDIAIPDADNADAPAAAAAPAPKAHDMANSGDAVSEPSPLVSSEQSSPMTETPVARPEKTGPTKEEIEKRQQEKREREMAKEIDRRMNFGSSAAAASGKESSGKSGSPDGNAASGALSGTPGTSLSGRTLESWHKPSSTTSGIIKIRVKVNAQGVVTDAAYAGGSGAAAANASIRRNCEQSARRSRFSVAKEGAPEQSGIITYRFN